MTQAVVGDSAPARPNQVATMATLEAAMAQATASYEPKAQPKRLTYAEARADLDARARAGKTVQNRDSKGHFTKGVKVFSVGQKQATAQIIQFRRPANDAAPIETPKPTQGDIQALLIAAMALAMPDKVKATIRRRLRCAYQNADDPHQRETARIAAEAMGVLV